MSLGFAPAICGRNVVSLLVAAVAAVLGTLAAWSHAGGKEATSPVPHPAAAPAAVPPPSGHAARDVLRAAACERCHGQDYDGLSAPSILAYVQTQDRNAFARVVLDGDIGRGMPGYRGFALVADCIDMLYDDFAARATARKPAGAVP
jgi:hypothetical protein